MNNLDKHRKEIDKIDDNIILDVLNTKEKRDNLSTARPEGLYLIKIKYN